MPDKITASYLHELQAIYHRIDGRGIMVDTRRLQDAAEYINKSIMEQCSIINNIWNVDCYIGSSEKPVRSSNVNPIRTAINLNSSSGSNTPLVFLKTLGFTIPKISSRDEDGNYIQKESLNELVLQKIYATNQFGVPGGDPAIRALLKIRELATLKTRYINANLITRGQDRFFLTNYNCAGTVTGRRGSRKHSFGYGGNAQNFPKHGELAKIYRRCLVARPGKILLMVDQMQAEDWPTSCLANNTEALEDLRNGVDRHRKLACLIFNLSWDHYTDAEWKDSIERYLGKKTRHANNYGMRANTMSDSLAKEGHSLTPVACAAILDKVNQVDPSVDGVFHEYVRRELYRTRKLTTPFGRDRFFFGLRAGDGGGNNKIFNEAFSYIPQSTVGDNTGFAVAHIEKSPLRECVIQEGHDSIVQEIDDNAEAIWDYLQNTIKAFDRKITFHNGLEIQIPVEGELGYDFAHTETFKSLKTKSKKLEDLTYSDVQAAWYKLQEHKEQERLKDGAQTETELDNRI